MTSPVDRSHIDSEKRNPRSRHLQHQSAKALVALMVDEDASAFHAVEAAQAALAEFLEELEPRFKLGGRLIYVGAGTSGRLGVLDASEMGPTFQLPPGRIVAIIAGGDYALRQSSEGLEDVENGAIGELDALGLTEHDTLLGITAGGTTPYVLGALQYAKEWESKVYTALLSCSAVASCQGVDQWIHLPTGPEVVAGSTRLKAGTATKMALNIISTALMIRCGYVHDNLMTRLSATNAKLVDRAARILSTLTGASREEALNALDRQSDLSAHLEDRSVTHDLRLQVHMDAGASKTRVAIHGADVEMEVEAGPGNILEIGSRGMRELLNGLFADLSIEGVPFRLLAPEAQLHAGMAGSACPTIREQLLDLLEEQGFQRDRVQLDNDVQKELQDGEILLAAGTGSFCMGQRGQQLYQAGGLGKVLGDEGSGYWMGLELMKRAFSDQSGVLAAAVKAHFGVDELRPLIAAITQQKISKDRVAALAERVFDLAEEENSDAKVILNRAADALFDLLQSVRQQLGQPTAPCRFAGSILTKRKHLCERIAFLERRYINSKTILPFDGTELDDGHWLLHRIREGALAGVLLFDRNIESPSQLRRLCATLRTAGVRYIAIDHEGGRVNRLPESKGFAPFVEACEHPGSDQLLVQAEQLFSLGINLNLAPVVDLAVNPNNFIVQKGRCYGEDPRVVIDQAKRFVDAHRHFGVTTVLKHFPGHGSSTRDSHEDFVDITGSWSKRELEPFRQLIADGYADMVMTAHVFHREIDPEHPASLSEAFTRLLREDLGYGGPIITDDLRMEAISARYPRSQALDLALRAGADLVIPNLLQDTIFGKEKAPGIGRS